MSFDLINFETFNPDTVLADLGILNSERCLLTIITAEHQLKDVSELKALLQQQLKTYQWILALTADCCIPEDDLVACLDEEHPHLDIVVQTFENDEQLAKIFATSQALIDLKVYTHIPLHFLQAYAMNKSIICQSNTRFDLHPEGLFKLSSSNTLDIFFEQFVPVHLRGRLLDQVSKNNLEWQDSWLNANLDSFADQYHHLNLLAISFWGRSGSLFMNALLDSHPETLTIGTGLFSSLSYFSQLLLEFQKANMSSFVDLVDAFCYARRKENLNLANQYYAVFTESDPRREAFFKYCFHRLIHALGLKWGVSLLQANTRKVLFVALQFAHYLSLGRDIRQRKWLVFQLHWPESLEQLAQLKVDFPDLCMLGMWRHPVRGFYSMLAHSQNQKSNFAWHDLLLTGHYLTVYRHILMGWTLAETLIEKPVYAVSLEQLHKEPEVTMKAVADYLKIQWDPCLLSATQDGLPFVSDSGVHGVIDRTKSIFDPERTEYTVWQSKIGKIEAFVLEALCAEMLGKYSSFKISAFHQALAFILIFIPTYTERLALAHVLQSRDEVLIKKWFLSVVERWHVSFLTVNGYSFLSHSHEHRQQASQVLARYISHIP